MYIVLVHGSTLTVLHNSFGWISLKWHILIHLYIYIIDHYVIFEQIVQYDTFNHNYRVIHYPLNIDWSNLLWTNSKMMTICFVFLIQMFQFLICGVFPQKIIHDLNNAHPSIPCLWNISLYVSDLFKLCCFCCLYYS